MKSCGRGKYTAPGATFSYTLENIYDRLNTGADEAPSPWSEPGVAPGVESGHTLSETMALAPQKDDTDGAIAAEVAQDKTFWGLNVNAGEWGWQTGTASGGGGAGVPDTGQTISYTVGDDGHYSATVGVDWPIPRFITGTTGIVTDTLTGLIWLQNANCFGTRTWAQALTDANTLNNGECGLSDGSVEGHWRLPNVRELYSLIHSGFYGPAVPNTLGTGQLPGPGPNYGNGDPFNNVRSSDGYWSSSTYAGGTSNAWGVNMGNSNVGSGPKSGTLYVWPVRGGQ